MAFEFSSFAAILPGLFAAALVNARLAAIIILIAIVGGTALTLLRTLKIVWLNRAIGVLISFIRGTPLLIQIFLCYYVLPAIGLDLSPEAAGVLAISLNSSIFITEMMRGGLESFDPGQIEAATALSLPRRAIWQTVILPQLFRRILPVLVNEMTIVVKGTALLSVITVVDVLRTAQQIASATYRPFETLAGAALVFLAMNLVVSLGGLAAEARLAARRI
ncbi:amino acid ABC transporter permease [Methylobacterium oryzihabitans]|uniref:Amino acid ABC transporter permease n=1 Tax=Methylobacterium oryzihabitans TaxID=2499852 RepID=A0A437PCV5_9HYPH|nr:amino acid ABC transporter permease [Methylobacterium oryzihabitans]RVU20064.1 amino acid ABC transporter permease [Methylobacterium oryzihabitans]